MQEFQRFFAERYTQPFYEKLIANTPAIIEFKERGFSGSFAWADSRLADDVDSIINQWREERNENRIALPVCLMAVRRDFMPSGADYSKQLGEEKTVTTPDGLATFKMRLTTVDRTVQVVFVGASEADTRSLSMQLCLFAADFKNRRFYSDYHIHGSDYPFPCVLESNELIPENVESEQKNISIQKIDFVFHESIPFIGEDVELVSEVSLNESTIASAD